MTEEQKLIESLLKIDGIEIKPCQRILTSPHGKPIEKIYNNVNLQYRKYYVRPCDVHESLYIESLNYREVTLDDV